MTLKELRISKKLTQLEASFICGVPLRTYKRLENDVSYQKTYKYEYVFNLLKKYHAKKQIKPPKKNITVVGTGYVGLSNAVVLAQHNKVYAVDIVKEKIDLINNKKSPIKDKELEEYLANSKLDLTGTMDADSAYAKSNIIIIATPTNYDSETNKFDTSSVESVIERVKIINPKAWIVIKSTVGVGFTKSIIEKANYKKVLFSPEFLREGKALFDNLYPSRIIVGVPEKKEPYIAKAKEYINLMRQGALKNDIETHILGCTEAEAVKLFANTYLALRVAYFNELDTFAQTKDLNTLDIIKGVCGDPRIGDFYNNPSFGYGGYCLPKDTKELKANFENVPENLISSIIQSNTTRKDFIVSDILKTINYDENQNVTIGIYKLAAKANSDNFRQSSILDVILSLRDKKGISILIYEPSLHTNKFFDCEVVNDVEVFKTNSKIIITNRFDSSFYDVKEKIYTRDLFGRD